MDFQFDRLLSGQANIGQSRSSVLNPLQWMTVILVGGLASFVYTHAPGWLIILMAVLLSLTFGLFAFGFVYFMIRGHGALRSEMYALLKDAMDKGYFTAETVALLAGQKRKIESGQGVVIEDADDIGQPVKRRRTRSPGGEG